LLIARFGRISFDSVQVKSGVNRHPRIMTGIELFGFAAVTVMVASYALEARAAGFVLLFALACLAAATYAALIRSWPFALVEIIWSAVALYRWRRRRSQPMAHTER
jgi:hypothetical protein